MHKSSRGAVSRLSSIQALRGFAASFVVLYHAAEATTRNASGAPSYDLMRSIAWLGNFGVDVFFVISGFIMIYVHFDDFGKVGATRRFMVKRLIRIVPNYWLLTAVATIIIALSPQLSQHGREVDVPWILASFLFVPWTSVAGIPLPVLGLGWTLNFEMYFYLVFFLALLLPRSIAIFALTAFFASSIIFGYAIDHEGAFLHQATHWLLAEFMLGILIGMSSRHGVLISNSFGLVFLGACTVLLASAPFFKENGALVPVLRFAFFGVSAACLVTAMTLTPLSRIIRFPRPVLLLGNASYSLYLTHLFTLPAVLLVLRSLSIDLPAGMTVLALFVASVLVAIAFYLTFEKPSQRFLQGLLIFRAEGRQA